MRLAVRLLDRGRRRKLSPGREAIDRIKAEAPIWKKEIGQAKRLTDLDASGSAVLPAA